MDMNENTPQAPEKVFEIAIADDRFITADQLRELLAEAGLSASIKVVDRTPGPPSDTAALDWLQQNFYAAGMDDWDRRMRPNQQAWRFFAPKGHQTSIRGVLQAAMLAQQTASAEPRPGAVVVSPSCGEDPPSVEDVAESVKVSSGNREWRTVRVGNFPIGLSNDEDPVPAGWPTALKLQVGVRYRAIAEATELPPSRESWPKDMHQDDRTFVFHNLARSAQPYWPRESGQAAKRYAPCIAVWTDGLSFKAWVNDDGSCALKKDVVYRVTVQRLD